MITNLSGRGFSAKLPLNLIKINYFHISADWTLTGQRCGADLGADWINDLIWIVRSRSDGQKRSYRFVLSDIILTVGDRSDGPGALTKNGRLNSPELEAEAAPTAWFRPRRRCGASPASGRRRRRSAPRSGGDGEANFVPFVSELRPRAIEEARTPASFGRARGAPLGYDLERRGCLPGAHERGEEEEVVSGSGSSSPRREMENHGGGVNELRRGKMAAWRRGFKKWKRGNAEEELGIIKG